MFYSKTTNGFYDKNVHGDKMPPDVIEITFDEWKNLLEAQTAGKVIQSNKKGFPVAVDRSAPEKDEKIKIFDSAAKRNLDDVARSWGYDSLIAAASYANSTNPQFKAEAEALIEWRDTYWTEAYTIEAGNLPATAEAFVALLPSAPAKPIV